MHISSELRWSAFVALVLASTACDSTVTTEGAGGDDDGGASQGTRSSSGSSTPSSGSDGDGGQGAGSSFPPTYAGGSPGFWDEACAAHDELWAQVLADETTTSGEGGFGSTGTANGPSGAGGSPSSGQGGAGAGSGDGGSGASGGGSTYPTECPSADDAAPYLGYSELRGPIASDPGQCCYERYVQGSTGRPMVIDGKATVARVSRGESWTDGAITIDTGALPPCVRARLHDHWLDIARLEHASIASFAKFSLELLLVGAPMDLVRDAQQAGLDEVAHAERSFAIAAAYGGERSAARAMTELANVRPESDVRALVTAAIEEGCVSEMLGAFEVGEQAALATSPALADTLAVIADDESRHAALAWRFVRWSVASGLVDAGLVRSAFASAIARRRDGLGRAPAPPADDELAEQHGLLPAARRDALHLEALRRVEALAATLLA